MDKELARYFLVLIDKDLQFSFNGMGIPSGICEWLENQLIQGNYDKVKEFIQKRYAENTSKKKRKLRAITYHEFCFKQNGCKNCSEHNAENDICSSFMREPDCTAPYRTTDDKYILVEVRE